MLNYHRVDIGSVIVVLTWLQDSLFDWRKPRQATMVASMATAEGDLGLGMMPGMPGMAPMPGMPGMGLNPWVLPDVPWPEILVQWNDWKMKDSTVWGQWVWTKRWWSNQDITLTCLKREVFWICSKPLSWYVLGILHDGAFFSCVLMNFVAEDSIHDLISSNLSFKSLNGWFDIFFKLGNSREKPHGVIIALKINWNFIAWYKRKRLISNVIAIPTEQLVLLFGIRSFWSF